MRPTRYCKASGQPPKVTAIPSDKTPRVMSREEKLRFIAATAHASRAPVQHIQPVGTCEHRDGRREVLIQVESHLRRHAGSEPPEWWPARSALAVSVRQGDGSPSLRFVAAAARDRLAANELRFQPLVGEP